MVRWNTKNSVELCCCPNPLQASFPPSCHPSLSTPWFWIHPVGSQNDHSWRDHLMIWWLDGFCYSKQTHWQYLLPPTRLLLKQSGNLGWQTGNLTNWVGNLAILQVCGISFIDMLWGVESGSKAKNAKNWLTLCARWCNNYNLDNNLDNQCTRSTQDNVLKLRSNAHKFKRPFKKRSEALLKNFKCLEILEMNVFPTTPQPHNVRCSGNIKNL